MMTQIRLPARRVLKSDAIASLERRNDVRWANLGHPRPDFQRFWTSLRSARGTGTMSPIASSQNPWKLRSYGSLFTLSCTSRKYPVIRQGTAAQHRDHPEAPCLDLPWPVHLIPAHNRYRRTQDLFWHFAQP